MLTAIVIIIFCAALLPVLFGNTWKKGQSDVSVPSIMGDWVCGENTDTRNVVFTPQYTYVIYASERVEAGTYEFDGCRIMLRSNDGRKMRALSCRIQGDYCSLTGEICPGDPAATTLDLRRRQG